MNVQVHRAVSDLTGKTGLWIVRAIVGGERDPLRLADLREGRWAAFMAEARLDFYRCALGDHHQSEQADLCAPSRQALFRLWSAQAAAPGAARSTHCPEWPIRRF